MNVDTPESARRFQRLRMVVQRSDVAKGGPRDGHLAYQFLQEGRQLGRQKRRRRAPHVDPASRHGYRTKKIVQSTDTLGEKIPATATRLDGVH